MKVIHFSAECYPVAKVGGLADVVGSLPKYLLEQDVDVSVVMPKYGNEWIRNHAFETVFEDTAPLGDWKFEFRIQRQKGDILGFPLYVVDIPKRFDRPGIYADPHTGSGYTDDFERFASFQIAILEWVNRMKDKPDVLHCHDHHTGLIPFMLTQSYRYQDIKHTPTVLTVHNGEYHGVFDRDNVYQLPEFDNQHIGLVDWDGKLNCLAAGLKSCWQITTVSESYMDELAHNSSGLEWLFRNEKQKSQGIINGIDTNVWDPQTDPMVAHHFGKENIPSGKQKNKEVLCEEFGLNPAHPTISYIGRLAYEKGADLLPDLFREYLKNSQPVNFIVLGTGDRQLHHEFLALNKNFVGYFDATLDFNEPLAHQIYAGSDFMLMPSRVEPCGLNQMYSMRYGTVPIVRKIGGLKDTVIDIGEPNGYGITFYDFLHEAARKAVQRALDLYRDQKAMKSIRRRIMSLDFSWNASAKEYIKMYNKLIEK
ncbi:glycogen synthase [Fodinibius halophilus]|uniref:Glycogen synthase n=1 Tax=Fodinibius halophilus TaxID=1736908 RepID=A0A6M1TDI5_9BACT|nr:glycogen synthase [Fodinibius halophilus]NGP86750.1 glycogen synthase [Fodinibius halophilus]